jgi:hypothetical protein
MHVKDFLTSVALSNDAIHWSKYVKALFYYLKKHCCI